MSHTVTLEIISAQIAELAKRVEAGAVQPRFFGLQGAERYAGLSVKSLRRLIATGDIVPLRPIKGKLLIDKVQLDAVILSSTLEPRKGRGIISREERQRRTRLANKAREAPGVPA